MTLQQKGEEINNIENFFQKLTMMLNSAFHENQNGGL